MPPRRAVNQHRVAEEDELDRRIEQIMDTRLGVALEHRLDVVVNGLAERMRVPMEARQEVDPRRGRVANPTADLEDGKYDSFSNDDETKSAGGNRKRGWLQTAEPYQRPWETGLRTDIPEFQRGLQPEEFLDWLATVEEVLEFKGGSRSADDYTNEFYQLVARNELQETEDQLVARYIGRLRVQLQDTINLFDPVSMSSVHQRALIVERQQKQAGSEVTSGGVAVAGTGGVVRAGGGSVVPGCPTRPANIGPSSSGAKCFKCGEPGHRQSECRKGEKMRCLLKRIRLMT
ncbi:hypothetical protein CRG98_002991 [Punica granatum]|uniref:CCHC-type domain-containing protein n=1 Tax=Punica granatum TaxID=22663 RepID=A0A2I0L7K9_PUNGR|nr:hypothetical protein CRG98_002991 [Punica granatum]